MKYLLEKYNGICIYSINAINTINTNIEKYRFNQQIKPNFNGNENTNK